MQFMGDEIWRAGIWNGISCSYSWRRLGAVAFLSSRVIVMSSSPLIAFNSLLCWAGSLGSHRRQLLAEEGRKRRYTRSANHKQMLGCHYVNWTLFTKNLEKSITCLPRIPSLRRLLQMTHHWLHLLHHQRRRFPQAAISTSPHQRRHAYPMAVLLKFSSSSKIGRNCFLQYTSLLKRHIYDFERDEIKKIPVTMGAPLCDIPCA